MIFECARQDNLHDQAGRSIRPQPPSNLPNRVSQSPKGSSVPQDTRNTSTRGPIDQPRRSTGKGEHSDNLGPRPPESRHNQASAGLGQVAGESLGGAGQSSTRSVRSKSSMPSR